MRFYRHQLPRLLLSKTETILPNAVGSVEVRSIGPAIAVTVPIIIPTASAPISGSPGSTTNGLTLPSSNTGFATTSSLPTLSSTSSPTRSPNSSDTRPNKETTLIAPIIGGVLGSIALLGFLYCAVLVYRRKQRYTEATSHSTSAPPPEMTSGGSLLRRSWLAQSTRVAPDVRPNTSSTRNVTQEIITQDTTQDRSRDRTSDRTHGDSTNPLVDPTTQAPSDMLEDEESLDLNFREVVDVMDAMRVEIQMLRGQIRGDPADPEDYDAPPPSYVLEEEHSHSFENRQDA